MGLTLGEATVFSHMQFPSNYGNKSSSSEGGSGGRGSVITGFIVGPSDGHQVGCVEEARRRVHKYQNHGHGLKADTKQVTEREI